MLSITLLSHPLMSLLPQIKKIPWDTIAFGMDCYEVEILARATLEATTHTPGHYTARIEPLASRALLAEYGYYYCDTLIQPYCTSVRFCGYDSPDASVSREVDLAALLAISYGAFSHGRFHRDFNIERARADTRYDNWLKQLHAEGKVYGLFHCGELAGFIGCQGSSLVLHAMAEDHRGQGLAKYLWTPVCQKLFAQGHEEITSSISAANLGAVKLYASLGFGFRGATDIYHRLTP